MGRPDVATADERGGIWLIAEPVCTFIISAVTGYTVHHGPWMIWECRKVPQQSLELCALVYLLLLTGTWRIPTLGYLAKRHRRFMGADFNGSAGAPKGNSLN